MLVAKEKRFDRHDKIDWYLAQIAVVIERLFMDHPEELEIAHRLIKFGVKDMPQKDEDEEDEEEVSVTEALFGPRNPDFDPEKAFWFARLGINPEVANVRN